MIGYLMRHGRCTVAFLLSAYTIIASFAVSADNANSTSNNVDFTNGVDFQFSGFLSVVGGQVLTGSTNTEYNTYLIENGLINEAIY